MTDKPASKDPIIRALTEARKEQGLTLLDLGRRLGRCTPQSVWRWESETNSPSLVHLHEWAAVLGKRLALVDDTGRDLMTVMHIGGVPVVVPRTLLPVVMAAPEGSAYDKPEPFTGGDHHHLVVRAAAR
jgi:transcriptional regulator with XRE-family HTH domain